MTRNRRSGATRPAPSLENPHFPAHALDGDTQFMALARQSRVLTIGRRGMKGSGTFGRVLADALNKGGPRWQGRARAVAGRVIFQGTAERLIVAERTKPRARKR